jgi:hypothetical protein
VVDGNTPVFGAFDVLAHLSLSMSEMSRSVSASGSELLGGVGLIIMLLDDRNAGVDSLGNLLDRVALVQLPGDRACPDHVRGPR